MINVKFSVPVLNEKSWAKKIEVDGPNFWESDIPSSLTFVDGSWEIACSGHFLEGELLEVVFFDDSGIKNRVVGIVDSAVSGGWRQLSIFNHTKELSVLIEELRAIIGRG
jgi:hypothetical protein